jgi:hypothetical protein
MMLRMKLHYSYCGQSVKCKVAVKVHPIENIEVLERFNDVYIFAHNTLQNLFVALKLNHYVHFNLHNKINSL